MRGAGVKIRLLNYLFMYGYYKSSLNCSFRLKKISHRSFSGEILWLLRKKQQQYFSIRAQNPRKIFGLNK